MVVDPLKTLFSGILSCRNIQLYTHTCTLCSETKVQAGGSAEGDCAWKDRRTNMQQVEESSKIYSEFAL